VEGRPCSKVKLRKVRKNGGEKKRRAGERGERCSCKLRKRELRLQFWGRGDLYPERGGLMGRRHEKGEVQRRSNETIYRGPEVDKRVEGIRKGHSMRKRTLE